MPDQRKTMGNTAVFLGPALGISLCLATALTPGLDRGGVALAQAADLRLSQPEVEGHARTCSHFNAKARSSGTPAQLDVLLAERCEAAFATLYQSVDRTLYDAHRARAYLDNLAAFKATLVAIEVDRMLGAEHASRPRNQPEAPEVATGNGGIRPISATGEYLIARQMGIIEAYHEWGTQARVTLAEDW